MNSGLPFDELEAVYDMIADAIDEVGADQESLFLAKLVTLLAHQCDDVVTVKQAISEARADLPSVD